jgi:hypothetical protein
MEDSFITADTLLLHEKMTDDICGFLAKLHPDMAETIRLEHDLQISKLRLQLRINQVLATNRIAQAAKPLGKTSPVASNRRQYDDPRPAQAAGLLPEQPRPGVESGLSTAAASSRPSPQTVLREP